MDRALDAFHPAVAGWFRNNFASPTPAQTRAWPVIAAGRDTLISAPTGSGKTLAAFLAAIDGLMREASEDRLPPETRVVYVSPLKALSTDVELNLQQPIAGIAAQFRREHDCNVELRTGLRTGDTTSAKRAAMLRKPPHILVTTPESLYILVSSERGREMLRHTQQLIVDEIHALMGDRRGAHLALTIARLEALCGRRLTKVGLSATQKPIEEVARFLVGRGHEGAAEACEIVDVGHRRALDLALELPKSPLEAVMSHEVWEDIYDRLAALCGEHRTTLIFVNTRRLAERLTQHLAKRLGDDRVTSHHGSLAKETRLSAERRLKAGQLDCLVATASLELGIDIGSVDLVCQIGSTTRIATFLQRVGRSGHAVGALPKGRLFPLSRDQLVEATALLAAIRRGELDRLRVPDYPRDILAQQIVAEVACQDYDEDQLFSLVRTAYPYRELPREEFDRVVQVLARGYSTHRGRRGAYLHHDTVHAQLRARRGARMAAICSGGAIPELADYEVILEPAGTRVGTINEDFAIESMAGDIFQLGNASWRILSVTPGKVRVADAAGQPPTIPFWLGEAPARSSELSSAVSKLREDMDMQLSTGHDEQETRQQLRAYLQAEEGLAEDAATQLSDYVATGRLALGCIPSQKRVVLERFFDESGGMQLVIHAPFGSRLNRAWGLALRKCFCRSFNFELQAAATEDAIVLSLGPTHSFPLTDVWNFLHPQSVRGILIQALLDAPMFETRWRWNSTRSLAVPRMRGGQRVAPQLQRVLADDLLTTVFPDQVACLENIAGDREIPDDPLVQQTIEDCLIEAMDIDALEALLAKIVGGEIALEVRELTEPSPFSHEILNANPYAFLDDAPLEERRTQAVFQRRFLSPEDAARLGALDQAAIDRVRAQAWPTARNPDELHDGLMLLGWLSLADLDHRPDPDEDPSDWRGWLEQLQSEGRAMWWTLPDGTRLACAVERRDALALLHPQAVAEPQLQAPRGFALANDADPALVLVDLVRTRIECLGPATTGSIADSIGLSETDIEAALLTLESQGIVMRGHYTPRADERGQVQTHSNMALSPNDDRCVEWCERGLLARIHRLTIQRLRAEIEPVTRETFTRFCLVWQHLDPSDRLRGYEGVVTALDLLEGWAGPAGAWEAEYLAARVVDYERSWLDRLCFEGLHSWEVWPRRPNASSTAPTQRSSPLESTPVSFIPRHQRPLWQVLRQLDQPSTGTPDPRAGLSSDAQNLLTELERRGASFVDELAGRGRLPAQVDQALPELVAAGLANSDGFAGLRSLLKGRASPQASRAVRLGRGRRRGRGLASTGLNEGGRWSAIRGDDAIAATEEDQDEALEHLAMVLLRRWGIVFRAVLERERAAPGWGRLLRVFRSLEARGEIRGGRFVQGFAGEQFALPSAVGRLRSVRRHSQEETTENQRAPQWVSVSARDPLNFTGGILPYPRVAAHSGNRLLFRDGVLVAAREAGELRTYVDLDAATRWQAQLWLDQTKVGPCTPREATGHSHAAAPAPEKLH